MTDSTHDHGGHLQGPHHHHNPRLMTRGQFISTLVAATAFGKETFGQTRDQVEMAESYRQKSEDAEKDGLVEPFKGITTDGTAITDLFQVNPTGVSTDAVRNAAQAFIASLTNVQLVRTMFPIDDTQWRKWANQNFYARQGICFREMTAAQRRAALDLMRASLSAKGFGLTRDIMRLNETLDELTANHLVLGEWAYYITFMGKPSATEPWGWQFQGPHAIINYFVVGDQVVMTPVFVGSEPAHASSSKYNGLSVLQQEQNDGLGMVRSLPDIQRRQAALNFSKTGNNNLTEAFNDNVVVDYAGMRADQLGASSRSRLRDLINLYVSNMDDGHACIKMNEVDRHIDNTWFAWIGGTQPDSVFYYRTQSPVLLIEFDHQTPFSLASLSADPEKPTRQHIHCVVRTPNGSDYGKDLLRQHYLCNPHKT